MLTMNNFKLLCSEYYSCVVELCTEYFGTNESISERIIVVELLSHTPTNKEKPLYKKIELSFFCQNRSQKHR